MTLKENVGLLNWIIYCGVDNVTVIVAMTESNNPSDALSNT